MENQKKIAQLLDNYKKNLIDKEIEIIFFKGFLFHGFLYLKRFQI